MAEGKSQEGVTLSSGNVFADLGFDNPEEELAKADLVIAMSKVIETRGLTTAKVAEIVGLDGSSVANLLRGRTSAYSIDRLIAILNRLGQDVEIRVVPKPAEADRAARLSVAA